MLSYRDEKFKILVRKCSYMETKPVIPSFPQMWMESLENLSNSLNPVSNVIASPSNFYSAFVSRGPKILGEVAWQIVRMGHLIVLRAEVAHCLTVTSQRDDPSGHSEIKILNQ